MEVVSGLVTVIVLLAALSVLVVVHELGHFLAAKKFGVRVLEFGLGYPPKAGKLFTKWGVEFTLNWLPFGGFVRLHGEERPHTAEAARGEGGKGKTSDDLFYLKRKWQRMVVILAGAGMNFLFGIVAFSIVFGFMGIPEARPVEEGVLVSSVSGSSPAMEAGVLPGDLLVEVEGERVESSGGFVEQVKPYAGEEIDLSVKRENEELNLSVYVRREEEIPAGDGALGVGIGDEKIEFIKYPAWQMPFRGAVTGMEASVGFGLEIVRALGAMVFDLASRGQVPEDVAGPVGIFYTAHKQNILGEGILGVLNFMGILSVNLAIVNVLPIPALDGGRALFLLLEKAMGKWFKPEYERYANIAGMVFLLALIGLISVRDVGVVIGDL